MDFPRVIDPAGTFDALVEWIHNEVVVRHGAPGVILGLSGTDSIVAFLAAYEAFTRAGKAHRVWGVHFAPSEDFVADHPEAEQHLWFSRQVVPWLRGRAPAAKISVDTSIDWRMDGVRWGMLGEMGAVSYEHGRRMREHADRFWLMGTRNRSEDVLYTYSNASMAAGFQPLVRLWKSEVLQVSRHLGVPQLAIDKSCDVDCICGRQRLPAHHIREVDLLLMFSQGELRYKYVEANVPAELRRQLGAYVETQINRSAYKTQIPYQPPHWSTRIDPVVRAFEDGSLDLRKFNHRQHLYVAWCYLGSLPLAEAVDRYARHLLVLLSRAGVAGKFSLETTEAYFRKLSDAMKLHPTSGFDELMEKAADELSL